MATKSQRTRKPAATKRSTTTPAYQVTLRRAYKALYDRTNDEGVCEGNGKQTIVMEALKVTANQADHIIKCLAHLRLISSNGKRGRGANYTVRLGEVKITAAMAKAAIEAIGPVPKAKTRPATKPAVIEEPQVALDVMDISGLADSLPEAFALLEEATRAYADASNRYTAEVQAHEETKRQLGLVRQELERAQHELGVAQVMVNKVIAGISSERREEILASARLALAPRPE